MTTPTTSPLTAEVTIAAPADTVFDYLVDPAMLVRWMGSVARIDPTPGGDFSLDYVTDDGVVTTEGTYLRVERPSHVSFTWGWIDDEDTPPGSTTVAIDLEEVDGSTIVRLTHAGLPDSVSTQHASGWDYFLPRLAAIAEGRPLDPDGSHAIGDDG